MSFGFTIPYAAVTFALREIRLIKLLGLKQPDFVKLP
jgi:hypothetical protein